MINIDICFLITVVWNLWKLFLSNVGLFNFSEEGVLSYYSVVYNIGTEFWDISYDFLVLLLFALLFILILFCWLYICLEFLAEFLWSSSRSVKCVLVIGSSVSLFVVVNLGEVTGLDFFRFMRKFSSISFISSIVNLLCIVSWILALFPIDF